jgi:hypothetical protein
VIEQITRELLTLGATRLNNPSNDQLWLPAKYAATAQRMLEAKAEYIGRALTALKPYLKR